MHALLFKSQIFGQWCDCAGLEQDCDGDKINWAAILSTSPDLKRFHSFYLSALLLFRWFLSSRGSSTLGAVHSSVHSQLNPGNLCTTFTLCTTTAQAIQSSAAYKQKAFCRHSGTSIKPTAARQPVHGSYMTVSAEGTICIVDRFTAKTIDLAEDTEVMQTY